ncbi:FtsW/RodA/SpoVE family cell cycle protein [Candidatus Saccharibacteria bacterium]|nr:FtsW/RodA/SpoVE family cell cycle protein [Candidatus Saccharibacteria bacterium]
MRKHKSNKIIGALTFLLLGVGLVVIYAIGSQRANFMNSAYGTDYDSNFFFVHQIISVVMSVAAFVVAFKLPYEKIKPFVKILMILSLLACALLAGLAMVGSSLASCQLGACRWINLGSFSLQPAEFLKLSLILYLADLIAQHKAAGTFETRDFWIPFIIVIGLSLFFVVILQKDLGTGACLIAIVLAMLWMSGVKVRDFVIVLVAIGACGVASILISPHRLERLMTFSGEGSADSSYHIDNAMMAIGTGGLIGVGVGNSVQATGYLPESINDSVFAVMGETFGFVGLIAILACFTVLLLNIMKVAEGLPSEDGLIAVGVFAWIAAHVVINIAAMTGLIPLTGITLPLLSYGGTSMIFISYGLGLVSQFSCYTGRKSKVSSGVSGSVRSSVRSSGVSGSVQAGLTRRRKR